MIHDSCAASRRWMTAHSSRGVGARPGRQKSLSSSITGRPVILPRRAARVDLPAAPGPTMITRFIHAYGANPARSPSQSRPGAAHGTTLLRCEHRAASVLTDRRDHPGRVAVVYLIEVDAVRSPT